MTIRNLIFFCALFSYSCQASTVIRVGKSQVLCQISASDSEVWILGQKACVVTKEKNSPCGVIITATRAGAVLALDSPSANIKVGNAVKSRAKTGEYPSAEAMKQATKKLEKMESEYFDEMVRYYDGISPGFNKDEAAIRLEEGKDKPSSTPKTQDPPSETTP